MDTAIYIGAIAFALLLVAVIVNIVMAIHIRRTRRRSSDEEAQAPQLSTIMKSPVSNPWGKYYTVELKDTSVDSEPSILNVTSLKNKKKNTIRCKSDPVLNLIADTPLKLSLQQASSMDFALDSSFLTPPMTPFGSRVERKFNPKDSTLSSMFFSASPTCLSTYSKDDLTPVMKGGRSSSISSIVDELSLESPAYSPIWSGTSFSSRQVFSFHNLSTLV